MTCKGRTRTRAANLFRKPEPRNLKPEFRTPNSSIRNPKSDTQNLKPDTRNVQPQTTPPRPKNLHPNPQMWCRSLTSEGSTPRGSARYVPIPLHFHQPPVLRHLTMMRVNNFRCGILQGIDPNVCGQGPRARGAAPARLRHLARPLDAKTSASSVVFALSWG